MSNASERLCNVDGHLWLGARCIHCGADKAEEKRKGGPAVERAQALPLSSVRATYDASTDPVPRLVRMYNGVADTLTAEARIYGPASPSPLYVMEYGKPGRLATAEERAEYERVTAPCKDEPPRADWAIRRCGCGATDSHEPTPQCGPLRGPSEMLGEALALQRRVADLLNAADPRGENAAMAPVVLRAEALVTRIQDLKHEADARDPES